MDFDKNQFLTDLFECLLVVPGDPARYVDCAIDGVITAHVQSLHRLAQRHRQALIRMVEEHRRTGRPVPTKWGV